MQVFESPRTWHFISVFLFGFFIFAFLTLCVVRSALCGMNGTIESRSRHGLSILLSCLSSIIFYLCMHYWSSPLGFTMTLPSCTCLPPNSSQNKSRRSRTSVRRISQNQRMLAIMHHIMHTIFRMASFIMISATQTWRITLAQVDRLRKRDEDTLKNRRRM